MLLKPSSQHNAASNHSGSTSPSSKLAASASNLKRSLSRSFIRPPSPCPQKTSRIPMPKTPPRPSVSVSDAQAKKSEKARLSSSPYPASPRASPAPLPSPRPRVPSRTQLRHATAARRLSAEGLSNDVLPSEYRLDACPEPDLSRSGHASTLRTPERKVRQETEEKLTEIAPPPEVYEKPPPYLRKSMEAAGVGLIADSGSMETLMGNSDILQASFLTPQSVLANIHHNDSYYHVWVAAMLSREELSVEKHGLEELVKLALTRFIIELGSALNDCLKPNLPHYTFVDPRRLMHPDGMRAVTEQAVAIVEGLEKKGLKRDRIYISIPATETGLAVAKELKERYGIKTNLVFVSKFTQAAACAAAGAAAVTMHVDEILTCHEQRRGFDRNELRPHPGRQEIKATACYMKHHNLETQVIATGVRHLEEIAHCSALDIVCIADSQVRAAKWRRMRMNRPPKPESLSTKLATSAPYPRAYTEDERGFHYLSNISQEARIEAAGILHLGMKSWGDAVERIADVLREQLERQLMIRRAPAEAEAVEPPSPRTIMLAEMEMYERVRIARSRSVQSWGEPLRKPLRIEFPQKKDSDFGDDDDDDGDRRVALQYESDENLEPPSGPPESPFWYDLNKVEDEPGSSSSSDEEATDDMILF